MHNLNPHNKNEKSLDDRDLTGDCKNQCLQYLLNELEPDQIALFEETLGNSEQLAEELQRQAEMIAILLSYQWAAPTFRLYRRLIIRCERGFAKLVCVALAVCIAGLAFRTWWSATGPGQRLEPSNTFLTDRVSIDAAITAPLSESTLIARAWAAGQADERIRVSYLRQHSRTYNPSPSVMTLNFKLKRRDDTPDDSFSWMFTAAFEIHEMETNDG